jgi:hypothetical protein
MKGKMKERRPEEEEEDVSRYWMILRESKCTGT